jgi:indolepyruvate ferredoxin oxidoreductase
MATIAEERTVEKDALRRRGGGADGRGQGSVNADESAHDELAERYLLEEGSVLLTGVQALARLPLEQSRRDRRAGLRTEGFISGYPGSPLGGYDLTLGRIARLLAEQGVIHVPALNEELAATAITGTQMLDHHPHSRVDGVVAFWYGKGPGLDRAGDAIRHGTFAGTSPHGAVVLLCGEDHEGKSSTMPFQDDYALLSAGIPILYPASVGEFLELGLHAIALSRFSGCWVALKLVAALCDGGESVRVAPDRPAIVIPALEVGGRPFRKRSDFTFFPGKNVDIERHLHYERHAAVRAYARANGLDRIEVSTTHDRLGIVTAGKSSADLRQALADMGLDDRALRGCGIRLLRMGLLYPIDADLVCDFARGLEELVVVEEKRGFLESQVKEALGGLARPPRVIGKLTEGGAPLFPIEGGMDADLVAERLGPRLDPFASAHPAIRGRLDEIARIRARAYPAYPARAPNYCSGCPHNTSTRLGAGEVAWGSPGCHSFASIIEQPERHVVAMTQYGGEGVPWVGLARFTDRPHIVQNVGDGSLFHSSYLNIRFCVAAGVNITFKILYNGAIANTGAQDPVGRRSIPELTRLFEVEGVRRIAVVSKNPAAYRDAGLAAIARAYGRERYEEALGDLVKERGVTVLIYDEMCANERRRRERRGKLHRLSRHALVHEEVCEGCGECGALTNCMSLHRVGTELGEKTRIHPSSCSQDFYCVDASCPSFVIVETEEKTGYARPATAVLDESASPEPRTEVRGELPWHIYMTGVGGTGVITVNAILAEAARIEGRHVTSYDQTGAAQKWGSVVSSLVIAADGERVFANKIGLGKADLYLALDPIGAVAPANLDRCDPATTAVVANTTALPTGEMVRGAISALPLEAMKQTIRELTCADRTVFVEAVRLSEALFGDHMMANLFALGVAFQSGFLPLETQSIERAIRLNATQVETNLQAFRYGRLWVHDPERVRALVEARTPTVAEERNRARSRRSPREVAAYDKLLARGDHLDEEARRMLAIRVGELIDYQDARYAESFVRFVVDVAAREQAATGGRLDVTREVIRNLYKLMAYKDEYEVARLYLKPELAQRIRGLFAAPRLVRYRFRPPLLRALGLKRQLEVGPWLTPVLRLLQAARGLRRTRFDPFGRTAVRREERALIGWYRSLVEEGLGHLRPHTRALVREIAQLPDGIRGYEERKLESASQARARAARLIGCLREVSLSTPLGETPQRIAAS